MFYCFLFLSLPLCYQCSAIFLKDNTSNTRKGQIIITISRFRGERFYLSLHYDIILIVCKQHALLICSHTIEKSMLRSLAVKSHKALALRLCFVNFVQGTFFFSWKKYFRRLQRVLFCNHRKWKSLAFSLKLFEQGLELHRFWQLLCQSLYEGCSTINSPWLQIKHHMSTSWCITSCHYILCQSQTHLHALSIKHWINCFQDIYLSFSMYSIQSLPTSGWKLS